MSTAHRKPTQEPDTRQGALLMAVEPSKAASLRLRLIEVLHENLNGSAAALRGDRSEDYRRQQLLGKHPITERDLAQLATHPAREAREAIRAFALELLAATEPAAVESIEEAAATFAKEAADVPVTVLRAKADGTITPEEAAGIAHEITEADRAARVLHGSLARRTA